MNTLSHQQAFPLNTLPDQPQYQQASQRIRAEYVEMPGMLLTPLQVQRLCDVPSSICKVLLDDLVRAKFLYVAPNGSYASCAERV